MKQKPHSTGIWYAITAFAALSIVALLIFFGLSQPETPVVTLPSPPAQSGPEGPSDTDTNLVRVEVNPDTVQAVLRTLSVSRVDSYSRHIRVETFWADSSSTDEMLVYVRGANRRMIVDAPNGAVQNILLFDGTTYIWYNDSDRVYSGATVQGDAERWQRMEDYEDLFRDDAVVHNAGYETYNGESCIFVSYITSELGYERRLYVSVKTGLLVGAETWDGDTLTLRVTGYGLDITTPSDEVFAVPQIAG